jgi:hypothetical protein
MERTNLSTQAKKSSCSALLDIEALPEQRQRRKQLLQGSPRKQAV